MHRSVLLLALALGAVIASPPAAARPAFPVPEPTAFPITSIGASFPNVAADGQGNYVLVWIETESSGYRVVARLFSPQGLPRGPKLQVATGPVLPLPAVAMNARGRFAVAWYSSSSTISAQIFAPSGARVGPEIQVNTSPVEASQAVIIQLGIDTQGRLVVAWSGKGGVLLRRFGPQGAPLAPEAAVVKDVSGFGLAVQPDGGFTLVWSSFDVLGQRFGADGEPEGKVFQVNRKELPNLQQPAVAATPDGGFVVAWTSCAIVGASPICEIRARRFDASSRPSSGELAVSPSDGRSHLFPVVTAGDARGYLAIGWDSCRVTSNDCKVAVQLFSPAGVPARDLATLAIGNEILSAISASPAGFVGVLTNFACGADFPDCVDTSPVGLYGWRFDFPRGGAAPGSLTAPAAGSDTD